MRNLYKQYGRVTLAGNDSKGDFKQRDAIAARWSTFTLTRSEIEAQAIRVFTGSGFGDATISSAPDGSPESIDYYYHRAPTNRSYVLIEIVQATLRVVGSSVRRMAARMKMQQRAYATYRALNALDSRTLRDLGFDRSELMSVAAEMSRAAETTRVRSIQSC